MSVIYTLQPILSYTDMSSGFGSWQKEMRPLGYSADSLMQSSTENRIMLTVSCRLHLFGTKDVGDQILVLTG